MNTISGNVHFDENRDEFVNDFFPWQRRDFEEMKLIWLNNNWDDIYDIVYEIRWLKKNFKIKMIAKSLFIFVGVKRGDEITNLLLHSLDGCTFLFFDFAHQQPNSVKSAKVWGDGKSTWWAWSEKTGQRHYQWYNQ